MTKVVGKAALVLAVAGAAVAGAAVAVLMTKRQDGAESTARAGAGEGASSQHSVPRLIEFGGPCPTCKDMKQVLANLEAHYPEQVRIEFVNYWNDVETSDRYEVKGEPTQVFLDPSGQELWRHEGMIEEEAMAAKWAELGYPLRPAAEEATEASAAPVRVRLFATAQVFLQGARRGDRGRGHEHRPGAAVSELERGIARRDDRQGRVRRAGGRGGTVPALHGGMTPLTLAIRP